MNPSQRGERALGNYKYFQMEKYTRYSTIANSTQKFQQTIEKIPTDISNSQGASPTTMTSEDSDHVHGELTSHSVMGIPLWVNGIAV
jgi:hypothetical protein